MKIHKKIRLLVALTFIGITLFVAGCKKSGDSNVTPTKASGFSTGGVDYNSGWLQITDIGSGGALGNIDVLTTSDTLKFFYVANMPKQSSGTYTFTNGKTNYEGSQLYAVCELGDPTFGYYSSGGTLIKTSINTFTFSCSMISTADGKNITVTGQGSY